MSDVVDSEILNGNNIRLQALRILWHVFEDVGLKEDVERLQHRNDDGV